MPIDPANSITDALSVLKVSRKTLYDEINAGRLRTYKVGRRRFVSADALTEWISTREIESQANTAAERG